MKNQPSEWEETIANERTDKGLISKISSCSSIPEIQTVLSKSKQKTWTDISLKMTYGWPENTWKDAQHCSLLEKCKSKLQWDITSHQSEGPSSKSLQTVIAGEDVEKMKFSCTVGGNVNWYSHYGRQYRDSFKIWE